jgi:hypothetical protein
MPDIQFNIPLPIVALITFIAGGIYKIWKLRYVAKAINMHQGKTINESYKNVFLIDAEGFLPKYLPLDPDREMEDLSRNILVRLYSGKSSISIYSRILDCVESHRAMLLQYSVNESLRTCKHYNDSYFKNVLLYFFLIELLTMKKEIRTEKFSKFKKDTQFLYDNTDGYFKKYTTISFQNSCSGTVNLAT